MHKNKSQKILYVINDPYAFGADGLISPAFLELPLEFVKAGFDVRVFQPFFNSGSTGSGSAEALNSEFNIRLADESFTGNFYQVRHPSGLDIICVKNNRLYGSAEKSMNDIDQVHQLAFLSHAVFAYILRNDFKPDIIHCMGWQTGLIPAIREKLFSEIHALEHVRTVFSVTNFFSQGNFDSELFPHTGLPWSCFNLHEMEFWGKFSIIKAGIVYSSALAVLGETHEDIFLLNNKSFGLSGAIAKRKDSFRGIPAGIDYSSSRILCNGAHDNPEKMIELKNQARNKLIKKHGLSPAGKFPLVLIAGDFSYYNRQDNNLERTLEILCQLEALYLILGKSNHEIIEKVKSITSRCSGKYSLTDESSQDNLSNILMGADILLMPTAYKSCPFMPLQALQYGVLPVVSRVFGGTSCIDAFRRRTGQGCGFFFEESTLISMLGKFVAALNILYYDKMQTELVKNCLSVRLNWEQAVSKYSKLFNNLP